jgi:hypothetical protein
MLCLANTATTRLAHLTTSVHLKHAFHLYALPVKILYTTAMGIHAFKTVNVLLTHVLLDSAPSVTIIKLDNTVMDRNAMSRIMIVNPTVV